MEKKEQKLRGPTQKAAVHQLALKKAQERLVALWEKKANATIKPGAAQLQHAGVPIIAWDANKTNSMEDTVSNTGYSEEGGKKD